MAHRYALDGATQLWFVIGRSGCLPSSKWCTTSSQLLGGTPCALHPSQTYLSNFDHHKQWQAHRNRSPGDGPPKAIHHRHLSREPHPVQSQTLRPGFGWDSEDRSSRGGEYPSHGWHVRAASTLPRPEEAITNVKKTDNRLFGYAVLSALHPRNVESERPNHNNPIFERERVSRCHTVTKTTPTMRNSKSA